MIGQTIAQYEILDQLGMGGMGIVYKAKDTNLGRIVALKFLPQNTLVSDDDKARFRREAQAAASLNHPNICTIHDLGETQDGNTYIAMEYVDGPTLKQEIETAPMKLDRAIDITVQVARGLHAAHSVDIVHRDVKTANIMLNTDGQVKIMDFGLAKTAQSTQLTKTGSTLGTFTFMSPEQARGDEVDRRTDIWSLGIVLYELVTGRLPFGGEYEQAMVYSILNQDPEPLTSLRVGVPVALDWIMAKFLAKDPGRRYQSANEAAIDLESIDLQATGLSSVSMISNMSGVSQVSQQVGQPEGSNTNLQPRRESGSPRVQAIVGAILLAIVAGVVGWFLNPDPSDPPEPVMRFTLIHPDDIDYSNTGRRSIAVSPNSEYYAFVANRRIYMGRFDSGDPADVVRGSSEGREVFFSPDSRWLGFENTSQEPSKLMKSSVAGGEPIPLADVNSVYGSSWADDGYIYLGQGDLGIVRVPENGGAPEIIVEADTASASGRYNGPQLLPGGELLLFSRRPVGSQSWNEAQIEVLEFDSGERTVLPVFGNDPRFTYPGYLLYGFSGTIYGAALDLDGLRLGTPVPLVEGVNMGSSRNAGPIQFSFSTHGLMSYIPGTQNLGTNGWHISNVDFSGQTTRLFSDLTFFFNPQLSPSGDRLAVWATDFNESSIQVYDMVRGAPVPLVTEFETGRRAVWSPDGEQIIFGGRENPNSPYGLWVRDSNLGNELERVFEYEVDVEPDSWSPDGQYVAFTQGSESGDLFIFDFESQSIDTFLATSADEFQASFSPDGKWLAYISNASGEYEVYVRPFPGPGGVYIASSGGGASPVWSKDGSRLYFHNLEDEIHSVEILFDPDPVISIPVLHYSGAAFAPATRFGSTWGRFDVDHGNERFIMMENPSTSSILAEHDELRFVVNWFEELKEQIPPLE